MTHSKRWCRGLLVFIVTLSLVSLGMASAVLAQDNAAASAQEAGTEVEKADGPKTAFEASDEAPKENLPGWPFLYGAYAIIWLLLFGYLLFLWRKHAAVEAKLQTIDKRMDDLDGALEALEKKRGS